MKIGIEQNILAKFVEAKYLPVAPWMGSAISVIKLLGVKPLWDRTMVLGCSSSLWGTTDLFKNRPKWAVETVGLITLHTLRVI